MNNPYTDITPETYPMRIITNIMRVKMFRFSCRLHKKRSDPADCGSDPIQTLVLGRPMLEAINPEFILFREPVRDRR